MPPLDQVQASFDVQAAYACGSGNRAALHLQTSHGRIVVTMTMKLWRALATRDTDANGRPWPILEREEHAQIIKFREEDPEAKKPRGYFAEKFEAAWEEWKKSPQPLKPFAAARGLPSSALSSHFVRCHGKEYLSITDALPNWGSRRSKSTQEKLDLAYPEFKAGEKVPALAAKYGIGQQLMYRDFSDRQSDEIASRPQPILKPCGVIL